MPQAFYHSCLLPFAQRVISFFRFSHIRPAASFLEHDFAEGVDAYRLIFRRGGIEVAEKLGALALVTKALKETAQPIDDIARSCGFKNGNYLKNLFRRRFGMTMREYRERG